MVTVKENHLEWALKHLLKYSHSDFYPRIFEFKAISHNWQKVKDYILSLDLYAYQPRSPVINLAPKPNGHYRIAHQLDPIDSLIYTSLIREVSEIIEDYRIHESENIACSYRIKPDLEGSFFSSDTGWDAYISKSEYLADKYKAGYVLVADITDFYNQIYTHRIRTFIGEAGKGVYDEQAKVIEMFLLALNKKTSRGIPVGPAPSIVLAELIMASIDNKILDYTNNFVRYVDDIRIFFEKREDALYALHELTYYLYSYHRLVFSGEKTDVLPVKIFRERYVRNEEKEENATILAKAEELALDKVDELFESLPPYSYDYDYDEEYEEALAEIMENEKLKLLSTTYFELFNKAVSLLDIAMLRHILRKAARYRIRSLASLVLDNFELLLPLIREAVVYLIRVINEEFVTDNRKKFESIMSAHYMRWPFVNLWISYLLRDESFNSINLPADYNQIMLTRGKALIALRRDDTNWVRGFRDNVDVLGPWDKRAVIYSSALLPLDEMRPWVGAVAASGDIIDESISSFLISRKKSGR